MTTANVGISGATQHTVDYLLIGGGLASATAAEEIRSRDPNGSILIVCGEQHAPYHRPPLSKEYLRGEINADGVYGNGGVYVQLPSWYGEHQVALALGATVEALDTTSKTARLSDGTILGYGKALIATGGRPRQLAIPDVNLPGVFALRTLDDSSAIREALDGGSKQVVVVGSGFIGLEGAANALFKGANVTIVDPVERAWPTMLSPNLSLYLQEQYTRRGAKLYYGHA
ncbi:MAG TPA: FAD/NAD(P)-binding oxidoreductase, partial [Ktedonobacterales bacterium]|nr:FAD/NAD(P)-binding oxidoreductase [Ktedonobacterales bacterium]